MFTMITKLCNCLYELGNFIVLYSLIIFDKVKIPKFLEYLKFLIHFYVCIIFGQTVFCCHVFKQHCHLLSWGHQQFFVIIVIRYYTLLYILRLLSGIYD